MVFFHVAALSILSVISLTSCHNVPTAQTSNGTYTGRYLAEFDQDLFLGIPYASPPRLDNPKSLTESWDGTRLADTYGLSCYTASSAASLEHVGVTVGEDCLNLNIIRPSGHSANSNLPVVVWFHGGSFTAGYGADGNTNTSYVVKASVENDTPIIAVTLNYRLGFLGFPGGYQAAAAGITNLGLKDQRMALAWVQENIAQFGGDPRKVTLWGQSAGAISIGNQILAYDGQGADDLFRGAILVSGSPFLTTNMLFPTHPSCVQNYGNALNATGCTHAENTLECLREAPADTIWDATILAPSPAIWPMIDGDFIREPPVYQVQKGHFSRDISILTGTNNDEGLLPVQGLAPGLETEEEVAGLLTAALPSARDSTIQAILEAYPINAPSPPYSLPMEGNPFCEAMEEVDFACGAQYRRLAAIFGDYAHISGRRLMAEQWATHGSTVYAYRFDTNPTSIPIVKGTLSPGFATHSTEYSYFFGFPPGYDMLGQNPPVVNVSSHLDLSRGIVGKFVSYVSTGDPNLFEVPFIPDWPVYSVQNPTNMVLNATAVDNKLNVHVEPDTWRKEAIDLWIKYAIELQFQGNWRP